MIATSESESPTGQSCDNAAGYTAFGIDQHDSCTTDFDPAKAIRRTSTQRLDGKNYEVLEKQVGDPHLGTTNHFADGLQRP